MQEGLVPAATGFVGLFFLICFLGWDKFLGDEFMAKFMIAILTGLGIAFFIWQARY